MDLSQLFSGDQLFTYVLFAVAGVAIFFMFRNSKKRREQEQEMRAKIQPGAEVLTQGGLYGTLISNDTDENVAIIETTPGVRLKVHSSVILRVVEPTETEDEAEEAPAVEASGEPEFGERVEDEKPATKRSSSRGPGSRPSSTD